MIVSFKLLNILMKRFVLYDFNSLCVFAFITYLIENT